jgi:formylglycine-generating enzyme required for sulfatase activity
MERRAELYTIIGLLLMALGALAAWFALPQFQSFATALFANPLFWPLVIVVVVMALLLPFTDLRALLNRVRSLLPGRGFERAYLRAIAEQMGRTPALLVISGRDDARRELSLLSAFSQLTLEAEDGGTSGADGARAAQPDSDTIFPRSGRMERRFRPRSRTEQALYILGWLLVQTPALAFALALLSELLWSAEVGSQLSWPRGGGALLVFLLWFLLARWLHTTVLPSLFDWWKKRQECTADPGTPGAEIWRHPRLLIRGAPGSGKTTLLRHIAVVCANERLGLSRRWRRNRVRDAYGWPSCPFPIYIPLRVLRLAVVQDTQPLLESYAETLRSVPVLGAELTHCAPGFFVKRAQRGGCLILLDAFDELRNAEDRVRLGRLIAALPQGPARNPNRIVVTSRIAGYEGQLDRFGFVHRRVAEMDDDQAATFVRARYGAMAEQERAVQGVEQLRWDPQQRSERLIRRLPENPGLRRLSRNPLLLSLAVSLHYKQDGRELPQERHLLYEKAVEMLAYEWERFKDADAGLEPHDEAGDLKLHEKFDMLAELAWSMFEQAPADAADATHAVTTRSRARDVLARVLEGMPGVAIGRDAGEHARLCRSEAERWLANLSERGGVLQEIGNVPGSSDSEIQFAHLTFQEYLAARAIDKDPEGLRERRLLERWDDPRWREVLLLYAATRPDATPVVRHLLDRRRLEGQMLAGYVLVERPRKLEQRLLGETLDQVRRLALETSDVDEPTALEALKVLEDAGALNDRAALLRAATTALQPAVRARVLEILAGAAPNRPAEQPAPDDLKAVALQVLDQEPDYRPRVAAGFALARNDPRYERDGWIPELVEAPAGPFLMGSSDADEQAHDDERPQHTLTLPTYWIGKTPVTNAQWRRFVEQGGYTIERYWTRAGWRWVEDEDADAFWERWLNRVRRTISPVRHPWSDTWNYASFNGDNQPVVGVSWFEAVAYCRWLSEVTKQEFYLPSEAEWEKAARGPHGLIYPWGYEWQPGRCNSAEAGIEYPLSVGSFSAGASLYSVLDMAGNVWEWCATKYGKRYPYDISEDEWNKAYLEGTDPRTLRGGAYYSGRTSVRGAYRSSNVPRLRSLVIGVRVARRSPRPDAEF